MRIVFALAPALLIAGCSDSTLEEQTDEEIAEIEKQVEQDAKSLEEAADEAVKVLEEEIEADLADDGIGDPAEVPASEDSEE